MIYKRIDLYQRNIYRWRAMTHFTRVQYQSIKMYFILLISTRYALTYITSMLWLWVIEHSNWANSNLSNRICFSSSITQSRIRITISLRFLIYIRHSCVSLLYYTIKRKKLHDFYLSAVNKKYYLLFYIYFPHCDLLVSYCSCWFIFYYHIFNIKYIWL